jgi:RHS repeat-associated protein
MAFSFAIGLEKLYIRYGTMKPQHPYDQTSQTLVSLKFYADTSAYGLSNLQPVQVYYASMSYDFFFQERGKRHYELTNHLGNVLTVISDKRMLVCNADTVTYSYASIISATDYSPFGAPLAGRTFSSESYRFRFNGKENDSETYGDGNALDFGARIYDSRLGRWLSVDPLFAIYPNITVYNFTANNPIILTDPDGEKFDLSNLNRDQKKAYKAVIKELKKSDIFKQMYKELRRSSSVVVIKVTNEIAGKFEGGNNGDGTATINPTFSPSVVQELYGAYQYQNINSTDNATITDLEIEQEVATQFISIQAINNGADPKLISKFDARGGINADPDKGVIIEPIISNYDGSVPSYEKINSENFNKDYQQYKPKFKDYAEHMFDSENIGKEEKDKKHPPASYTGSTTNAKPSLLIRLVGKAENKRTQ